VNLSLRKFPKLRKSNIQLSKLSSWSAYDIASPPEGSIPKEDYNLKIVVVGTGYVGLVTGVCFAEVGHSVTCVDKIKAKIDKLKKGEPPIYEPGLEALLRRNIQHERLTFTTEIKVALAEPGISAVFIAVGTPPGEDGSADLRYVEDVAREIGQYAQQDFLTIVKSTVPVGTCDRVEKIISEQLQLRKSPLKITVASNPEFLKEGKAIDDFMRPDRIVVGVGSDADAKVFSEMYQLFIQDDPGKLQVMGRRSSELTKYGANAMLATRISFMNELARLCEKVGANIDHVRLGIGSDPRIGRKFLYSGPGYGGSCFPKDVNALLKTAHHYDVDLKVLSAVTSANEDQKLFVTGKVKKHFGTLSGKKIAIWGLAFKPGTDDVRETPALTLIRELLKDGAQIVGHDPEARETFALEIGAQERLTYTDSAYEAIKGAHGLVLVTEWSEYKRPNWQKIKFMMVSDGAIFDFRNQWSGREIKDLGFSYYCVGRGDTSTR
jgi:UDPglucose 6-dehydrogenase